MRASDDSHSSQEEEVKGNQLRTRTASKSKVRGPSQNKVSHYQLGDVVGRGATGTVFQALDINTAGFVAIKQISKKFIINDTESSSPNQNSNAFQITHNLSSIKKELSLLRNLNHPNIVRLLDYVESDESINLVFEYAENGSLSDVMKKFGAFPESVVALYIDQVLEGLNYLHSMGVVHRDIKGSNILITKTGIVKLADFGVASTIGEINHVAGSPYWMAPEVIEDSAQLLSASDIWSLGCTIIELMTGDPPYFYMNPMAAMFHIAQDPHPPIPDGVSKELEDFLIKCFVRDPKFRPTAKELASHPWISTRALPVHKSSFSYEELKGKLLEYHQSQPANMNTEQTLTAQPSDSNTESETLRQSLQTKLGMDVDTLLKDPETEDSMSLSSFSSTDRPQIETSNNSSTSSQQESFQKRRSVVLGNSLEMISKTKLEKPVTRKRFNSLNSKHTPDALPRKEGYLKSDQKYWFVLHKTPPVLSYYSKSEDYIRGKPPKGQLLLISCDIQTTHMIKDEPYSILILTPFGTQFCMSAESEVELEAWIDALYECQAQHLSGNYFSSPSRTNSQTDLTVNHAADIIKQQQEKIKQLQRALTLVLEEQDHENRSRLRKPTEDFYKEFFFFLTMSVKRNESVVVDFPKMHQLYDEAKRQNVPYYKWYQWIPAKLQVRTGSESPATLSPSSSCTTPISSPNSLPSLCSGCKQPVEGPSFSAFGQEW
eukprot:CAMPEP_0168563694 /NCGR_PEP_ID=MMETSP0413-20121227/12816_1 /TAXON_ID=136452 /ORGANISM="Filamoeba nolandi, Strain NC-AS-23-1" /LENGTH=714 /DNA_ID=CAMNT_0008595251 /DNA_START=275 /DNA_END=2416 /DNA_ORIENTATION=-